MTTIEKSKVEQYCRSQRDSFIETIRVLKEHGATKEQMASFKGHKSAYENIINWLALQP